MKRVRLLFVCLANALVGVLSLTIAIRATAATDRRTGFAVAILMGGLAALVAATAVLDRGPRDAPSAPLHIDADGVKRLDRLELFVSPARVAIVAAASLIFFDASYISATLDPNLGGWIVAGVGICVGLVAAAGAIVQGSSRKPVISLDAESLTYRLP